MIQGKVLVTGATGDTGGATVEELLSRGHRVRALAHRQDERSKQLQERGVEVVFGDLLDFSEMRAALKGVQRGYLLRPSARVSGRAARLPGRGEAGVASSTCRRSPREARRATPRPSLAVEPSSTGRGDHSPTGRPTSPTGCSLAR